MRDSSEDAARKAHARVYTHLDRLELDAPEHALVAPLLTRLEVRVRLTHAHDLRVEVSQMMRV